MNIGGEKYPVLHYRSSVKDYFQKLDAMKVPLLHIGDQYACLCGCNRPIILKYRHFYARLRYGIGLPRFLIGHKQRLKMLGTGFNDGRKIERGSKHHSWKGGRPKTIRGYVYIYAPEHPKANKSGYIFEHRLVMEKMLGRSLEAYEFVHHRNGIKEDNRPENLEIVLATTHHGYIHCPYCRKEFLVK